MKRHERAIRVTRVVVAIIFWLGVWSFTAWRLDQPLLLPMPHRVAVRLWELMRTAGFWSTVGASLLRVLSGLVLAVVLGCVLAVLTERYEWLNALLSPLLSLIRSVPVASFILLAVLWMGRDRVPVFIVVLMALPVVWSNVAAGIHTTDPALLEMARAYGFSRWRQLRRIWLPSVMPQFLSACRTALGLSWKAGVAAEVLTVPAQSIGRMLYTTKLNLEVEELFAWTAVVVVLSLIIEQGLLSLLSAAGSAYNARGGGNRG